MVTRNSGHPEGHFDINENMSLLKLYKSSQMQSVMRPTPRLRFSFAPAAAEDGHTLTRRASPILWPAAVGSRHNSLSSTRSHLLFSHRPGRIHLHKSVPSSNGPEH